MKNKRKIKNNLLKLDQETLLCQTHLDNFLDKF